VNDAKLFNLVLGCAICAWVSCGFAWIAWQRRQERRAAAASRVRQRAEEARRAWARVNIGMPVNHPETPGTPGEREATWLGHHYAAWDAELPAEDDEAEL
jgi:hypothetical protein